MLKLSADPPLLPAPPLLFLSMKSYMEQLVLIILSMAKTVRNTFILVTQRNIYTFIHIYLHMFFFPLGCIYVYLLSRVGNNLQSVFQSVLLWAVNKSFPNLGSWQLNPTTTGNQTAGLWKAQPIHLDRPYSKGPSLLWRPSLWSPS